MVEKTSKRRTMTMFYSPSSVIHVPDEYMRATLESLLYSGTKEEKEYLQHYSIDKIIKECKKYSLKYWLDQLEEKFDINLQITLREYCMQVAHAVIRAKLKDKPYKNNRSFSYPLTYY